MPEAPSLTEVLALLNDEFARSILAATSIQAMSATELAEVCDASKPTVYRRIDRLKSESLVREQTAPDEDGHHRRVYESAFRGLDVELVDGEFRVEINREDDPADRFTAMWGDLR